MRAYIAQFGDIYANDGEAANTINANDAKKLLDYIVSLFELGDVTCDNKLDAADASAVLLFYCENQTLNFIAEFDKIRDNDYTPVVSDRPWIISAPTYCWQIPKILEDAAYRSLGILKYTRFLYLNEAIRFCANLRMGIKMKLPMEIDLDLLNKLQQAVFKFDLPDENREIPAKRADLVRSLLKGDDNAE
jgi:hypothetical protein